MGDRERLDEIQARLDRLARDGWDDDDLAGALRRLREERTSLRVLGGALRNALIGKLASNERSEAVARWDAHVEAESQP